MQNEPDVLKNGPAFVQSGTFSSHLAVLRAIGGFHARMADTKPEHFRRVLACNSSKQ
jgi:hypothetical protein